MDWLCRRSGTCFGFPLFEGLSDRAESSRFNLRLKRRRHRLVEDVAAVARDLLALSEMRASSGTFQLKDLVGS